MDASREGLHPLECRAVWRQVAVVLGGVPRYAAGMNTEVGVVMTTFPDEQTAARVLDGLLEKRLAACVQTMPIQSAYRWQGAVNREGEVLALIKTKQELFREVEEHLRTKHPYEVPEILLLPAAAGSAAYLQWIAAETK